LKRRASECEHIRGCSEENRDEAKVGYVMVGYDFDTAAHDVHTLMTELDLRDVALVGHAMGTGEVTR
jgi:non-heme chloroperoxidase